MCKVSVTDFRNKLSYYIELSEIEDIHITKNGEVVAILTSPNKDYYQKLSNLYGCLKDCDTVEDYKDVIGEEIIKKCY